ncbi:MAG: ABC transporter ATP-binding protein [Dehalococcoidia bacterium]|nr:ABC transporter ATP-binding protein [Dehalococcoidia bacterium]
MINIRQLNKFYGGRQILRDINLNIDAEEVFSFIGPSGAGKTTLLRLIDLLERPTSGTILYKGVNTAASENIRIETRRKMAMVFQRPAMFGASVFDNVAYGLKVRGEKNPRLADRVGKAIQDVGLAGYEEQDARTLSGGEIQRVALARALVISPEVLLLDEPTANLDPVSTVTIEKLIMKIIGEMNITVIMSTHDMAQGQRLAGKIAVMMEGRILQTGDPGLVFNKPENHLVARFVGVENIFEGNISSNSDGLVNVAFGPHVLEGISDLSAGEKVNIFLRPEEITLTPSRTATSARNSFRGEIMRISLNGPLARVELDCGFPMIALITRRSAEELNLQKGQNVYASFKATQVHIIKR